MRKDITMKIAVLDAKTLGDDLSLAPLYEAGDVTVYPSTAPEEIVTHLHGADVAVLNKVKLTADVLNMLPQLKLITVTATGYDNIDTEFCREHKIAVCNVAGYSTHSVAQLTLAMALSLYTKLPSYQQHVNTGAYTRDGVQNCLAPVFHELSGRTWGIVGFGNIGRQVGLVAQAMGCRVLVNRRTKVDGWNNVSLETLLKESDIVSLHVPLTIETRHLLDERALSCMKPDAMLINVARGAVTDEAAVAKAILGGKLGYFAADVYENEPFPAEHPFNRLLGLPQVCLTPHMAWGSYESRSRCLAETVKNIMAFERGEGYSRIV